MAEKRRQDEEKRGDRGREEGTGRREERRELLRRGDRTSGRDEEKRGERG